MIDRHDLLLERFGTPAWLREYRRGTHLKETFLVDRPAGYYGCPPALVPLTSNGSLPQYEGIWTRWFCGEPGGTRRFVCAGPEDGFLLDEVARDDGQFAVWLVVRALVCHDGADEAGEIAAFRTAAGISDDQFAAIDAHTGEWGDDPAALHRLAAYAGPLPAGIGERSPAPPAVGLSGVPEHDLAQVAYFELGAHGRESLGYGVPHTPPWLLPQAPVREIFERFHRQNRLREAWLALNSTGWAIGDARRAALALAQTAGDPLFTLQMEAWVAFTLDEDEFIPDDDLGVRDYENYDY